MANKATGEPGIRLKGKHLYQVYASFGTGKNRKRKSITVHGTLKEARKVRAELIAELDNGLSCEADKTQVRSYFKKWLRSREADITHATYTNYMMLFNKWIEPYLGGCIMKDIKRRDIIDWHSEIDDDGISPRTKQAAHKLLKQAFRDAVENEIILVNTCDRVKTPKADLSGNRGYLELEEMRRMLDILDVQDDSSFTTAVRIGISTGARRGEILGLEWRHFNPNDRTLYIQQNLVQVDGIKKINERLKKKAKTKSEYEKIRVDSKKLKAPKSKTGLRYIDLDDDAVEFLQRWKTKQAEQLQELGVSQAPVTPICCSMYAAKVNGKPKSLGNFLDPQNFSRDFNAFCDAHNFYSTAGRRLCFHELRHGHATLLLSRGMSVVDVAERLGDTPAVVAETYVHTIPGRNRKCADIIGDLKQH